MLFPNQKRAFWEIEKKKVWFWGQTECFAQLQTKGLICFGRRVKLFTFLRLILANLVANHHLQMKNHFEKARAKWLGFWGCFPSFFFFLERNYMLVLTFDLS